MNITNNTYAKNKTVKTINIERIQPKKLATSDIERLIDELYSIAVDSFGWHLPREAISERTKSADYLFLAKSNETISGYATNEELVCEISTGKVTANYFSMGILAKKYQNTGLYDRLNDARVTCIDSDALITRTQHPKVHSSFKRVCELQGYALHPLHNKPSDKAIEIAKYFCKEADDEMVVREVYWNRSLSQNTPKASQGASDIWNRIDTSKGDALILVGLKE